MPRSVQITVAADNTDALLNDIAGVPGVLSVQVQHQASVAPPGDVITVQLPTQALHELIRVLDARDIGRSSGTSFATSEPISLVSSSGAAALVHETSDASWEEIELLLAKESNMTPSAMLVMALSGVLAAVGIASDALHLVIAGMLIAPGFEPLCRISLGAAAHSSAWRRGIVDVAKGYAALVAAAFVTALVLRLAGLAPLHDYAGALEPGDLAAYWTSLTLPAFLASFAAASAGGVLVATNRTVLTAGAMVGLALIPSASLVGIAVADGDGGRALEALGRWAVDVLLVLALCWAVLAWKGARLHRRRSLLSP